MDCGGANQDAAFLKEKSSGQKCTHCDQDGCNYNTCPHKGLVGTTSLPLATFSLSNIIVLKTNNTFLVYGVLSAKPGVILR